MDIQINKKARIILKEGTGAMQTYSRVFLGYIKDLAEVYDSRINLLQRYSTKIILMAKDECGEESLIPLDEIEAIQYL